MNEELLDALESALEYLGEVKKDPAHTPTKEEHERLSESHTLLMNYYMLREGERWQCGRMTLAAICGAGAAILIFLPEIVRGWTGFL